jgi:hypothetical protein
MKLPARNVAWLLPLILTACFHKTNTSQSQPFAPPLSNVPKPATEPVDLPPSATTIPSQPIASDSQLQPAQKAPVRHRRQANRNSQPTAETPPPPAAVTQQAAVEPPAINAIGQLSSGDASDSRQQTLDSIASTERGLNGINRTLNDQEQKTALHIKEFLKQSREALSSGDVDGAKTLAAKAKVLLGELLGK